MILIIDTTNDHIGKAVADELRQRGGEANEFEWIDTT